MASSLNVRPVACISEWHSNLETLTNLQHRSANNQQNTVCTTLVYIALRKKILSLLQVILLQCVYSRIEHVFIQCLTCFIIWFNIYIFEIYFPHNYDDTKSHKWHQQDLNSQYSHCTHCANF